MEPDHCRLCDRVVLVLPHPPASLSPNGRAHWSERGRDAQRWRRIGAGLMVNYRAVTGHDERDWPAASLRITWMFAGRQPDDDNCIARLKPVRDGLADAGLIADDGLIHVEGVVFERVKRHEQAVVLTLTRREAQHDR